MKKIILSYLIGCGLLLGVYALFLVVSNSPVENKPALATVSATSPQIYSQKIYHPGDLVNLDTLSIELNSVEKSPVYTENVIAHKGYTFIILNLTINNSGETDTYTVDTHKDMTLRDERNSVYHPIAYIDGTSNLNILLEDNSQNVGKVAFEVPERSKNFTFEYDPNWLKNTAVVFSF